MADIPNKPSYDHGSTGTAPGSPIDYANGDPVDDENFDYFIYEEFDNIKAIIDYLNAVDSNEDGQVDAADTADDATNVTSTYKGNDIDSDGDGVVDKADNAVTYKGNDIDADGDGTVDNTDKVQGVDPLINASWPSESGIVNSGNAASAGFSTELADGDSLNVYRATFHAPGNTAIPSGVDLIIAVFDGGGGSVGATILSGDGSTVYSKRTGNPQTSYTNTTGSPVHVEIMVDNGQFAGASGGSGSNEDVVTSLAVTEE